MLSALYAIARPSVRLSVTQEDQSKTVELRGMQFSPYSRPVSESESERQRARNGASESERDFSRERATIHTSESKRAKFRMGRDFSFYSALQWNSYVCSIYRTYMGTQSHSGFHCFNTSTQQTLVVSGLPAVSVNYLNLQPSRLVLLGIA